MGRFAWRKHQAVGLQRHHVHVRHLFEEGVWLPQEMVLIVPLSSFSRAALLLGRVDVHVHGVTTNQHVLPNVKYQITLVETYTANATANVVLQ